MRPGGFAVVGIPFHRREVLSFNANRVYNQVQLPHLFANWEQAHLELDPVMMHYLDECNWCYQPLFVVRKPDPSLASQP